MNLQTRAIVNRNLVTKVRVIIKKFGYYTAFRAVLKYILIRHSVHRFFWYWWARWHYGKYVTKNINGNLMKLDISDRGACTDLLMDGIREVECTHYFQSIMKPDWTVLDIGANIGYYALQEARKVRKVIAIEPYPKSMALLKENVKLNNFNNIETIQLAIGESKRQVYMDTSGYANLVHVIPDKLADKSSFSCPMDTVDNLFSGVKIDYLRMDVEGYGFNILRGADKVVRENNIGMFIEVHKHLYEVFGSSMDEFLSWLQEHKMRIERTFFLPNWEFKGYDYHGSPNKFMDDPNIKKIINKYSAQVFWLFLQKMACFVLVLYPVCSVAFGD